jgi:hypothetical protein
VAFSPQANYTDRATAACRRILVYYCSLILYTSCKRMVLPTNQLHGASSASAEGSLPSPGAALSPLINFPAERRRTKSRKRTMGPSCLSADMTQKEKCLPGARREGAVETGSRVLTGRMAGYMLGLHPPGRQCVPACYLLEVTSQQRNCKKQDFG